MKKQSRLFYVVLAVLAVLAFKWNCLTWRHYPAFVATDYDSGRSANIQTQATNAVPIATNSLVSGQLLGKKSRKTYRGIPLTELIPPPWTREKAFAAQCEPWWGRPFDPVLFWEGLPVWMDDESVLLANRHGRVYPPIPVQFASGRVYSQKVSDPSSIEYRMPRAFYTDEEERFWSSFSKKSPQPPEAIDRWLKIWTERRVLSTKQQPSLLPDGRELKYPDHWKRKEPEETIASAKRDAQVVSMPFEVATKDALYWEYVRGKRIEYAKAVANSPTTGGGRSLELFLGRLDCPAELVQNPPTAEEIRVTTGWRIEYLRRLRREGTDESYIEAYKKAWHLSEDDLREDGE